ncbi:hypothetical protein SLEP1_g58751 [Rubroshorea leprosula]|uniref:Uncharacterized protein n=1 Tax=Rubroshorea leprosula TaxID=152421 RepID=A0AAV5MQT5_9ROSI|nr:hypothetical protein SLEP1_g58751 [Rubroshorea leprosula]
MGSEGHGAVLGMQEVLSCWKRLRGMLRCNEHHLQTGHGIRHETSCSPFYMYMHAADNQNSFV